MVSFDIFDTLITRRTISPHGIFLLVQEKLLRQWKDTKYCHFSRNFCTLRINAEKDARISAANQGREEVTIDEIYDLLAYRNNLPKELVNGIKECEIQSEIEYSYPLVSHLKLLEQHLSEGEHVVLISDMYLSERIIREMLIRISSVFCDMPIYVSCETGKTKQSGSLFFEVAKRENASFGNWLHYGDNRKSDYLVPKMLGIDARYLSQEELKPWEKELNKRILLENSVNPLALQLYLGAARNLRAENKWSQAGQIGASLGGMILYPYVWWLIHKSMDMGIRRLYFIARDGYVLKRIGDAIIRNQKLDLITVYVYGSRNVWRNIGRSKKEESLVKEYLSQEVDFSDSDFAFVDLHGSGVTMRCLSDLILKDFQVETKVFYFDLLGERPKEPTVFLPFCSEHSGISELFCRAPHGTTVGYEQKEGKIVPSLQPTDREYWTSTGLADYFKGIEMFAEHMSEFFVDFGADDVGLVETALEYCKKEPCKEVLEFLGSVPHCDGIEKEDTKYAPVLSSLDVFNLFMWRTVEDDAQYYSGINLNLSLFRSSPKCKREKLFWERHYNRFLGRCIHKWKNMRRMHIRGEKVKVILYAAGKWGKRLYEHLQTTPGVSVAAWVDMDYERYQKLGYPVVSLQEITALDYHYIVVAIENHNSSMQVQSLLEQLGFPGEKIIDYQGFLQKYGS